MADVADPVETEVETAEVPTSPVPSEQSSSPSEDEVASLPDPSSSQSPSESEVVLFPDWSVDELVALPDWPDEVPELVAFVWSLPVIPPVTPAASNRARASACVSQERAVPALFTSGRAKH